MKIRQIIPTSVTLLAMLAGFLSILIAVEAMSNEQLHPGFFSFRNAALLIMVAMILDGLDGNLARWLKGESDFGAELDTYVDMTAFGLAPAVLIFAVAMQQKDPIWRLVLPAAVCVSGVVRLARFKVKDPLRGQGGYSGLPITVNAGWVAMFVYISQSPPVKQGFSLDRGWVATLFLLGICTFITLQVSNVRYPKPTKNALLFGICVAMVAALMALSLSRDLNQWAVRLASVMIALGVGYIILGPLFVKGVAVHKAWKEREAARLNGSNADNTRGDDETRDSEDPS